MRCLESAIGLSRWDSMLTSTRLASVRVRSLHLQSSIMPLQPGLTWPHSISSRLSAAKPAMNHRCYGRHYVYLIRYRFPLPSLFYLYFCLFGVLSKVQQQFVNKLNLWCLRLSRNITMGKISVLLLLHGTSIDLRNVWCFFVFLFWLDPLSGGVKRPICRNYMLDVTMLYLKDIY